MAFGEDKADEGQAYLVILDAPDKSGRLPSPYANRSAGEISTR